MQDKCKSITPLAPLSKIGGRYLRVKFCGMSKIEDVELAVDLGVDYVGFILEVDKSRRSISRFDLEKIVDELISSGKRGKIKIVGVVVNADKELLDFILDKKLVDVIQFHGNEDSKFCKKYKSQIEVWKALNVVTEHCSVTDVSSYKTSVDKILLDAGTVEQKNEGNDYKKFNAFELYKKLEKEGFELVLAGGINSENIKFYIKKLNPKIVDLSSGIESDPGVKDHGKMREFVEVLTPNPLSGSLY